MLKYGWTLLLFTGIYLALTSNLEPLNILLGLLVAVIVVLLVRPPEHFLKPRNMPRTIWATLRYILMLIKDLVASGIVTARLVLSPSLPIKPGIIKVPSDCQTDLGVALSAHAITLTPGELVVETGNENEMYTHCLDATQPADLIAEAQNTRREMLNDIFP